MTTHTFTFLKSFLVRPYISVHRFKKLVQLLPVKIRKFSCLIFGAYVFALIDCSTDPQAAQSQQNVRSKYFSDLRVAAFVQPLSGCPNSTDHSRSRSAPGPWPERLVAGRR